MLKLVKNHRECVLVSVEELVQQEHLLRMIVNNYKFVFSIGIGKSFPDRPLVTSFLLALLLEVCTF
ncbi:hypothetical protein CN475_06310 [Bacillus cereus]|uniref:Uncharacterized protein n=1 Tax=Bacillus cereus TaxID=1396 RepID=A0A9X6YTJ2_BACCE|nr:hypothetical protein CN475_06310 [Bacillus cereus]